MCRFSISFHKFKALAIPDIDVNTCLNRHNKGASLIDSNQLILWGCPKIKGEG